jgi:protein-tyrosine phosphatase
MTDLHTHLLPALDDGAADMEKALELLRRQSAQGVRQIALTSHYRPDKTDIPTFLERRAAAWRTLSSHPDVQAMDCTLKLGAEVEYAPQLMQTDVRPLCLEGTNVLLLELQVRHRPQFLGRMLDCLQEDGIIPLIAHAERYDYVQENPALLMDWADRGAYIQINGGSLLRKDKQGKMAMKMIQWGLAHVVASDTHSPEKRPPCLQEAMALITQKLGERTARRLQDNASLLFDGEEPDLCAVTMPRKIGPWWI